MNQKNEVFEKTYNVYLGKIEKLNLPELASKLKLKESGGDLLVSLLGTEYQVSVAGIIGSSDLESKTFCLPVKNG